MDVLDGKKLVCPLNLTEQQAREFTTLMPLQWIMIQQDRHFAGLTLPVRADLIVFPRNRCLYGAS